METGLLHDFFGNFLHMKWKILFSHGGEHVRWDWTHTRWDWTLKWALKQTSQPGGSVGQMGSWGVGTRVGGRGPLSGIPSSLIWYPISPIWKAIPYLVSHLPCLVSHPLSGIKITICMILLSWKLTLVKTMPLQYFWAGYFLYRLQGNLVALAVQMVSPLFSGTDFAYS